MKEVKTGVHETKTIKSLGVLTIVHKMELREIAKDRFEHYYILITSDSRSRPIPNEGNYFLSYKILSDNIILLRDVENKIVLFRIRGNDFTTLFTKNIKFEIIEARCNTIFFLNNSDPRPIGYVFNIESKEYFSIGNKRLFHIFLGEDKCEVKVNSIWIPFDTVVGKLK